MGRKRLLNRAMNFQLKEHAKELSGLYFYVMRANNFSKSLVIVKYGTCFGLDLIFYECVVVVLLYIL